MLDTPLKDILRTTSRHLNKLKDLGIRSAKDLLLYFPRTYNDRSDLTKIIELNTKDIQSVRGIITHLYNQRTKYGKYITKAKLTDETGSVQVVWFNQPHIKRMLSNDMEIILTGIIKPSVFHSSVN